jgi:hypothetical protein
VNLGQLFQQYYFDSYGAGPPLLDPSRFEYLQLVAAQADFRFVAQVAKASVVKRRAISTEMGQAFCRWMLSEHFSMRYFAHMNDVVGKKTHAAFEGMCVERTAPGDVPDYLCAWNVTEPVLAEAKGRFSSIGFDTTEFNRWRQQFQRVRVLDRWKNPLKVKGYIVGSRLTTVNAHAPTTVYTEDPETDGRNMGDNDGRALGRVIAAIHYHRVFQKLDLRIFSEALLNGYAVAPELRFNVPVWECGSPPLRGQKFVGGFYLAEGGTPPRWSPHEGWTISPALGRGHAVFVGLELKTAQRVARAARGAWESLDQLPEIIPQGSWSSEFSWLSDGTVLAPLEYFFPTGSESL